MTKEKYSLKTLNLLFNYILSDVLPDAFICALNKSE